MSEVHSNQHALMQGVSAYRSGIEDDFIEQTSATLKPGTAALFVQAKRVDDPAALEAAISQAGGTVITTRLNREAEEALAARADGEAPA